MSLGHTLSSPHHRFTRPHCLGLKPIEGPTGAFAAVAELQTRMAGQAPDCITLSDARPSASQPTDSFEQEGKRKLDALRQRYRSPSAKLATATPLLAVSAGVATAATAIAQTVTFGALGAVGAPVIAAAAVGSLIAYIGTGLLNAGTADPDATPPLSPGEAAFGVTCAALTAATFAGGGAALGAGVLVAGLAGIAVWQGAKSLLTGISNFYRSDGRPE